MYHILVALCCAFLASGAPVKPAIGRPPLSFSELGNIGMQQFYSQRQSFDHSSIRPSTAPPDSFELLHLDGPAQKELQEKAASFLSKALVQFKAQKSDGLLKSKSELSQFISEHAHSLAQVLLDGSKQLRRIYPRGKSVPIVIPDRRTADATPRNERGHSDDNFAQFNLEHKRFAQFNLDHKRRPTDYFTEGPSHKRVKTSDRLLNEGSRLHRSPSTMDLLALRAQYEETIENLAKSLVTDVITKARI